LVFDVHRPELETVEPIVREMMQQAIPMSVPILVEMNTGENWLEAH
jgi:DNA polymerase-1